MTNTGLGGQSTDDPLVYMCWCLYRTCVCSLYKCLTDDVDCELFGGQDILARVLGAACAQREGYA